jgi:hypothetical protein
MHGPACIFSANLMSSSAAAGGAQRGRRLRDCRGHDRGIEEQRRRAGRKGPYYTASHTTPHTTLHLNKNREVIRQRKLPPGSNRHGVQGAHLNPLGPFLRTSTPYMAYSECLATRLNPLAERICFSQAPRQRRGVVATPLSARPSRQTEAAPARHGR